MYHLTDIHNKLPVRANARTAPTTPESNLKPSAGKPKNSQFNILLDVYGLFWQLEKTQDGINSDYYESSQDYDFNEWSSILMTLVNMPIQISTYILVIDNQQITPK